MPLTLSFYKHHFVLKGVSPNLLPPNTLRFVTEGEHESPTFTFDFHFVEHLPLAPSSTKGHQWEQVFTRPDITVWHKGTLERRLLSSMECPYAIYEEDSDHHADIWFPLALSSNLSIDGVLISTLSLERHLAPLGTYIFHCAYMSHDGKAVLLSGPSGAGKSTHAHLWEQFVTNTYIVNGDRCLINRQADGRFYASGWPICGSSGICRNECHPLHAIAFIEQTPDNQLIQESPAQLFTRLYSQLTVNHWNMEATAAAADWVLSLLNTLPVMVYGCNMAPDAPFNLYDVLFKKQKCPRL